MKAALVSIQPTIPQFLCNLQGATLLGDWQLQSLDQRELAMVLALYADIREPINALLRKSETARIPDVKGWQVSQFLDRYELRNSKARIVLMASRDVTVELQPLTAADVTGGFIMFDLTKIDQPRAKTA